MRCYVLSDLHLEQAWFAPPRVAIGAGGGPKLLVEMAKDVRRDTVAAAVAVLAALALAGCSSSSKSTSPAHTAATPATTSATKTSPPAGNTAAVSTGPVRAALSGPDHAPVAGRLWPYTVKATDASGKPLSGTVATEFAFGGTVVGREVPPTHALKNGTLRDKVTFPPQSVGEPLTLQVVVRTAQGTVTLDWPVTPKR